MTVQDNTTALHGSDNDRISLEAILNEISARMVIPPAETSAVSRPAAASDGHYIQIMTFHLGDVRFGIELLSIDEVIRNMRLTRVPGTPGWLKGVTSFHGEIISVVDLGLFLGIDRQVTGSGQAILVAHTGEQRIGLIVDGIDTIYTTPADQIASPSFPVDAGIVPYLRGAIEFRDEYIRLLQGDRLLLGQQMQQFS